MAEQKGTTVVLRKPNGEIVSIENPDRISFPDQSRPYWTIAKENMEINTTGEVWIEDASGKGEALCEDAVSCTGVRCFHKTPHYNSGECDHVCRTMKKNVSCNPYKI